MLGAVMRRVHSMRAEGCDAAHVGDRRRLQRRGCWSSRTHCDNWLRDKPTRTLLSAGGGTHPGLRMRGCLHAWLLLLLLLLLLFLLLLLLLLPTGYMPLGAVRPRDSGRPTTVGASASSKTGTAVQQPAQRRRGSATSKTS